MQQWQAGVPLFNEAGDLHLSQPLRFDVPNGAQQQQIPRTMGGFAGPFTASPPQQQMAKPDFAMQHYSPPQMADHSSPLRPDSAPKVYHFANAGPDDFQVKHE